MKALDTNALVRLMVRDDEAQAQAVRTVMLQAETRGESLFVSLPVLLEILWVLASAYDLPRERILIAVETMTQMPLLELEARDRLIDLCQLGQHNTLDLSDLLIGLCARDHGCETTLTFDKKAAKSDLFTLIEAENKKLKDEKMKS